MCFCCTWQAWAGYSGTPTEPSQITAENYSTYGFTADNYSAFVGYYAISTAEELYGFAAKVNSGSTSIKGVLTADIVVNDSVLNADGSLKGTPTYSWTPIGNNSYKYAGTFDGNGHTVSGLYFNNTNTQYVGLFGYVYGSSATVKNVGVIDSYFNGAEWVAGVVGKCESYAKITNCYNNSTVSVYNSYAFGGGVCGHAYTYVSITKCYNAGKIDSKRYSGGVCGLLENYCTMSDCYNVGSVYGTTYVGGVTSNWSNSSTITNCCYLAGCAVNNYNTVQYGLGLDSSGSLSDVAGKTTSATADDFASGKVAYLLNGQKSDNTIKWYQTIGEDEFPVTDNSRGVVYASAPCASGFSNTPGTEKEHGECDAFGRCPACGEYLNVPVYIATAETADSLSLSEDFVGYYALENAAHLYWFAQLVNSGTNRAAKAVLTADITVNEDVLNEDGTLNGDGSDFAVWTPIGSYSTQFTGTFDGNGHTISGLYFNDENANYVGLFGYNSGYVKNLGIADSYFYGYQYVGAISGCNGTITDCYNAATVKGRNYYTGGICGYSGTQNNCYNIGTVQGSGYYTGGICGGYGTQTKCYNNGVVLGYYLTGGICGGYGTQTKCYNIGTVSSTTQHYVGGICGGYGTQNYCYNAGEVLAVYDYVGGICGGYGSQTGCFNVGEVSGRNYVGGISGMVNSVNRSYCLEGTADNAGGGQFATADDFAGGKVAYGLNGTSTGTLNWYQTLGDDELPVWDNTHSVVYASAPCASYFSNTEGVECDHSDCNALGQCTACGEYLIRPIYVATAETADSLGLSADYVGFYAIENTAHLYGFASLVNNGATSANAVLMANITVNDDVLDGTELNGDGSDFTAWTPIGKSQYQYYGTFDGQGHTISGIYINNEYTNNVGLFGYVSYPVIKNISLTDSYIRGSRYVGGFCGFVNSSAKITNCHNAATVYASYNGENYVGGICGYLNGSGAVIDDCSNSGYVYGAGWYVGGICGYQYYGKITNSHNSGKVYAYANNNTGNNSYTGGISGYLYYSSSLTIIDNCYNTGNIESKGQYVGGIVGYQRNGSTTNCFSTGTITAFNYARGIIGYWNSGTATNNFALKGSASESTGGTFATADQFAGGMVTYKLNGESSVNPKWFQTIGEDAIPVRDTTHAIVYHSAPCPYSNDTTGVKEHHYVDDVCTNCGHIIHPELVDGWYEIASVGQLIWLADTVNSGNITINARLVADIALNDNVLAADGSLRCTPARIWTPIGNSTYQFNGTFDGQGHTISGVYVNSGSNVGLFGYINSGTVKNVVLADSYITGSSYVGGICGYMGNSSALIENCHNAGSVNASNCYAGGICGYQSYGKITGCHNSGYIYSNANGYTTNSAYVGGITGYASNSTAMIENSYNNGSVKGLGYYAGGIVGYCNNGSIQITKCYNTGAVEGYAYVGGIGGRYGSFSYCFNVGLTKATNPSTSYWCGICGYNGSTSYCYSLSGSAPYAGGGSFVNTTDFASGKVAYWLNGSVSGGTVWRQTIGTDAFPTLDTTSLLVYTSAPCPYSNNSDGVAEHDMDEESGFCTRCGAGSAPALVDGWYEISKAAHLYWLADTVNNYGYRTIKAKLVADIVVNDSVLDADGNPNGIFFRSWTPIGTTSNYYQGTFDGQGHTISGLYFSNTTNNSYPYGGNYVGLFGYISGGTVKDLGVIDSYIHGYQYVGAISGSYGTITNCYNAGTVKGAYYYTGGICGYNGTQTNCYNSGVVTSTNQYTGGICGMYGTQTNCYNTGTVTSTSYYTGGICGYYGTENNCYNTGAVSGYNDVGGISGAYGSQNRCFSLGTVTTTGGTYLGGINGYQGTQTNCYYLAGSSTIAGGGIAATAADFASGKVAYGLNGNTSTGTLYWYQAIGTDTLPVWDNTHGTVYASEPCHSAFGNNALAAKKHVFDNFGQCTLCGDYLPATLIADATTADGLGLDESYVGYYAIGSAAQLYWFANLVNYTNNNANAVLTADIVFNDSVLAADGSLNGTPARTWTPIGTSNRQYNGTFDGQGHTISGLYINDENAVYIGLFGYISSPTIKNIDLADSYISGSRYVGGIIGYIYSNANILNCNNAATVYANYNGDDYAGGICGYISSSAVIYGCRNTGYISCYNRYAGGICGYQSSGTIANCYNTGKVYSDANNNTGNNSYSGGISGYQYYGTIANCYNTGAVEGKGLYAGGIVGYINNYNNNSKVTNCYNTGIVKASNNVGGIYGYNNNATTPNNYVLTGSVANANGGTFTSKDEFASGQIAFQLNGSAVVGYDWYQTLGSDTYPVLDNSHAQIWAKCDSTLTNDSAAITHHFVNGVCSVCGAIDEVPALVDGWYLIDNHHKLYWFANKVNSGNVTINGKLTADIVVNENVLTEDGLLNGTPAQTWTPIGTYSAAFAGKFDGQGHTISGLYLYNTNNSNYPNGGNYIGLFGYAGNATITNVGVIDSYFYGYYYVGGICGYMFKASAVIDGCYNAGYVGSYYRYVGGICGYQSNGKITNCYNAGKVYSYAYGNTNNDSYTGGITGYAINTSAIENCYNTGTVESYGRCVGGIIGYESGTISVNKCYNTGDIKAEGYYAGGIVGYMGSGSITSCFSTGTITAYGNGYGITGNWSGTCTNNYVLSGSTSYANGGTLATAEEFASGKVAYGLNGSVSGADGWYQNLSSPVDSLPVMDSTHGKVWRGCGGVFVNDPDSAPHHYVNGRCTECGEYIEPSFADGWFEISNWSELYWFAEKVNSGNMYINGKLVADIVVNDSVLDANGNLYGPDSVYRAWTTIGTTSNYFRGKFDGQGHTISGLYFNNTNVEFIGLFGYTYSATISNLGVTDTYFNGYDYVGGIVGWVYYNTTITNCFSAATLSASSYYGDYLGGIVGGIDNYNSNKITSCYNIGKIAGNGYYVGGICGYKGNSAIFTNSFYADSCAFDGDSVAQFGIGYSSRGYTTADVEGGTAAATAAEFASGKVAYGLNGNVGGGSAWFQNLTEAIDSLPVLDSTHARVWLRCDSTFTNGGIHIADSIVIENVVAATYTTVGSYDSVVYCSLCGIEISRTTIEVPMLIATVKSIELKKMPKVNYTEGEKLDVSGAVVLVTFTDGSTKEVALTVNMVSGFDGKKVGEQKLTVTYTVDGETFTTTFTVKVEKNTAIADVAADKVSIFAINRTIVVETAEPVDEYIHVFDANGRLIAKELAVSNRTEIAMTRQGLYIVRIGNKAERVMVY